MLDSNTLYLILAMIVFLMVTVISVHRHNTNDQVKRKRGEVEDYMNRLTQKIAVLDNDIIDLKLKIDELDEEIDSYNIEGDE